MKEIQLVPLSGKPIILIMSSTRPAHSVEEVLKVRTHVFEDMEYYIDLGSDVEDCDYSVYINDEFVETVRKDRILMFSKVDVFDNILGFVRISINTVSEGKNYWYYSGYLSVLVKPSRKNKSITAMLNYVYKNQGDFLYHDSVIPNLGGKRSEGDFWSQMILVEDIANIYENCYGFFMANSRYKLEKREVLDRIEKLQYVDSKTIQYISQHPENLERSVVGIGYGSRRYIPRKTLMSQNTITYDIYENRVVIGFLKYMVKAIKEFKNELTNFIDSMKTEEGVENGYLISSFVLFERAKDQIYEFNKHIDQLESKYEQLLRSYSGIINISEGDEYIHPKLTAIFANVPQYNRIYNCIVKWNNRSIYNLEKEHMMMSFFNAPEIFETYALAKLINQLLAAKFELISAKYVDYPKRREWGDTTRRINNTFIFRAESGILTLYYEPVIYCEDLSYLNGIFLYRNNTVSLNRDSDIEFKGRYYVPDYILKYELDGKESYIICDAKYTNRNNACFKHIPDLSYKYITSISTMKDNAALKGLYLFYGITDDFDSSESFFNVHLDGTKKKEPELKLMPMAEEIPEYYQDNNMYELIRRLMN